MLVRKGKVGKSGGKGKGKGKGKGNVLPAPPGCSGANSVRSYTVSPTTSHKSSGILCLEISWTEMVRAMPGDEFKGLLFESIDPTVYKEVYRKKRLEDVERRMDSIDLSICDADELPRRRCSS